MGKIYCEDCQAYFEGVGIREHRREDRAMGIPKRKKPKEPEPLNTVPKKGGSNVKRR
jgi:uncharacterized Zn finger protein (UPF0148 family)